MTLKPIAVHENYPDPAALKGPYKIQMCVYIYMYIFLYVYIYIYHFEVHSRCKMLWLHSEPGTRLLAIIEAFDSSPASNPSGAQAPQGVASQIGRPQPSAQAPSSDPGRLRNHHSFMFGKIGALYHVKDMHQKSFEGLFRP